MKCIKCGEESIPVEIKGALGIRVIYCCNEYHVDYDSLRPKVREVLLEEDKFWKDLAFELGKFSPTSVHIRDIKL